MDAVTPRGSRAPFWDVKQPEAVPCPSRWSPGRAFHFQSRRAQPGKEKLREESPGEGSEAKRKGQEVKLISVKELIQEININRIEIKIK